MSLLPTRLPIPQSRGDRDHGENYSGWGGVLPDAGASAEGGLDAPGVLVVAHGVPELAFGDGGVPVVGAVAVAALEGAHGVFGVAPGVEEPAQLVGAARKEAAAALRPPGNLWPPLAREDEIRLPLHPQCAHLEGPRQHAQGAQRERVFGVEPERPF